MSVIEAMRIKNSMADMWKIKDRLADRHRPKSREEEIKSGYLEVFGAKTDNPVDNLPEKAQEKFKQDEE